LTANQRPHSAILATLIGIMVVSWPFNLIFGKIALRYFPVLAVVSFRLVAAGIIMLPIFWLTHARKTQPETKVDRKDFWTFLLLSIFGVIINQGCFVVGLNYTTVGHSALIMGMGPITILILTWHKGLEVATSRKIIGLALAFTGVVALAVEKGLRLHGTLVGDLITLCGSAGFALYTVIGKRVSQKYDSVTLNTFNYVLSAIILTPIAAYQLVAITRNHGWINVDRKGWAGLSYLAIFGSVIAFLIYTWALRYVAASRMGAFTYTHPIVSTALGIFWLGESITRNLIIGGLMVLTGIYLIQTGRDPENVDYAGKVCEPRTRIYPEV
jgi:drug/metabolite transporter (DMT)-like permease